MIAAADNNPLKLTATADEAVRWLVRLARPRLPAAGPGDRRHARTTSRLSCRSWSRRCSRPCAACCAASTRPTSSRSWRTPRSWQILAAGGRKARYWELFKERYRELARRGRAQFLREVGVDIARPGRGASRRSGDACRPTRRATACCPARPSPAVGCSAGGRAAAPAPAAPAATSAADHRQPDPQGGTGRQCRADGAGRPVQVRLLKLATVNDFMEADFFALDADPAAALGKALMGEEKLTLGPGQVQVWQREFEDEARFVGVMAAYRDIGTAHWRAFAEVPRNQTTLLDAEARRRPVSSSARPGSDGGRGAAGGGRRSGGLVRGHVPADPAFPAAGPLDRGLCPGCRRRPGRPWLGVSPAGAQHRPARHRQDRPDRGRGPAARRHAVLHPRRCRPSGALQTIEATREGIVYLCLAALQPGAAEVDADGTPGSGARLRGRVGEIKDSIAGMDGRAPIEVARPVFSLRHERDEIGGFVGLGVARIKGREAGRQCRPRHRLHPAQPDARRPPAPAELPGRARGQAREHRRGARRLYPEPAGTRLRRGPRPAGAGAGQPGQAAGPAPARAGHGAPRAALPVPGRPRRRDGDLWCRRPPPAGLPDLPPSRAGPPSSR